MYAEITEEDIWHYRVVDQIGVRNLTAELYTNEIYNKVQRKERLDKPWWICLMVPHQHITFSHSTFIMKSLYFLQRDFSEKAHYAFADASNEMIREAFDYEILPACIYVREDGRPFYANEDVLGINVMQEFMIRHEEIAAEATGYLMAAPSAITIYPHYWYKSIGMWLNNLEGWLSRKGRKYWAE